MRSGRVVALLGAGQGPTHPCRLLSEFLRWLLRSDQVDAAAISPAAAVTLLRLAFAPLRQHLSSGADTGVTAAMAEETAAQQQLAAGILWSICQVKTPGQSVFMCLMRILQASSATWCWLHFPPAFRAGAGKVQFGQPKLAALGRPALERVLDSQDRRQDAPGSCVRAAASAALPKQLGS
jgi:hypothetical protein